MILNIELENQNFLDIDFENSVYITGPDQRKLWKIFRSLYYYFNKNPRLTANVYGEDKIKITEDGNPVSIKNNNVYFIDNRNSIYQQMTYKKDGLLSDFLNSLSEEMDVNRIIEKINDDNLQLEIIVQKLMSEYSDNIKPEFQEINYLDLLKNDLLINYEDGLTEFPLEFMDTEILLDEFINFLRFKLNHTSIPTWLVLYNLDSFISPEYQNVFIRKIKDMMNEFKVNLIYLGNSLSNVPLDNSDFESIIVAAEEFHQLLPFDEFKRSIQMHYPNKLDLADYEILQSLVRVIPCIGSRKKLFISSRDLVLLKVVNDMLGYGTSFDLYSQSLSDTEAEFLKD